MRGIVFTDVITNDSRDTAYDWDLVMSRKIIGTPKLKYKSVTLPDRDGDLDYTEALFGVPLYDNRTIELTFEYLGSQSAWFELFDDVRNFLHGKKMFIYEPDDDQYYYVGRVEVGDPSGGLVKIFDVKVTANPWKLKRGGETIVTKTASEGLEITLENDWKPVVPTIETTGLISLQYRDVIYTMDGVGTFRFPKMLLRHGSNVITVLSGDSDITFRYQEGAI